MNGLRREAEYAFSTLGQRRMKVKVTYCMCTKQIETFKPCRIGKEAIYNTPKAFHG